MWPSVDRRHRAFSPLPMPLVVQGAWPLVKFSMARALSFRAMPCGMQDCGETPVDVFIRRRPIAHADAHRRATLPNGPTAPARALLLNGRDGAPGLFGVSKSDQNLIQYDVI